MPRKYTKGVGFGTNDAKAKQMDERNSVVMQMIKTEHDNAVANAARLKALRLEKEANENQEQKGIRNQSK